MRRQRAQQTVIALIVVAFVVATIGLVTTSDSAPEVAPAPTTMPRPDLDEAACRADVDRFIGQLDAGFRAAAAGDGSDDPPELVVSDDDWTVFFENVADHCADVGSAVSDVIVFASEQTDATDDPVAALGPALTAAQLCSIGLQLTRPAALACASAGDLGTLLDPETGEPAG